ncbi:MAG TPA: DUF6011 domain-containing protein [Kineosporiaceae bacterium]
MTALTLLPSAPSGGVPARCRAPRRDGSGPCNRALTDETSRARGIGPDCWDRLHPLRRGRWTRPVARFPAGPDQEELPFEELLFGELEGVC